MQRLLIVFICLFSFGTVNAQDSSVNFIIKNLGVNVDGHFNEFTISTDFNSEGELNTIASTIEVSSIETGIESRDEHILEEDYFDVKQYLTITLKSIEIKVVKPNHYDIEASLTIKGKTKKVTIPVTVQKMDGNYKITSYFEINRRDFDVGGGGFVMGKIVKINVTHYQHI
ncbi:YceI family protein [Winogradskyella sp. A2]|uniref:YceI family protein n=1 Tax=Winogradskyella sp. A2 TaxID=3366944 RepID=UPI00398C5AE5